MTYSKLLEELNSAKEKYKSDRDALKQLQSMIDCAMTTADRILQEIDKKRYELHIHDCNMSAIKLAPVILVDEWSKTRAKRREVVAEISKLYEQHIEAMGTAKLTAKTVTKLGLSLGEQKRNLKSLATRLKKASKNVYLMSDYDHLRRQNEGSDRP
jgi:mevalonate kinase